MASNKATVTSSFIQRQEFDYRQGNISLNFKLRIDNLSELAPFKKMLEMATKDVDEMMEKITKGKK